MRTMMLWAAAASMALAQAPAPGDGGKAAPKKSVLEAALEEALRSNPDIRIAEAQLVLAQAALSKARHDVAAKVVQAEGAVALAKASLKGAEMRLRAVADALRRADAPTRRDDFDAAETAVVKARAELDVAEAMLKFLQGKGGGKDAAGSAEGKRGSGRLEGTVHLWDARTGRVVETYLDRFADPSRAKPAEVAPSMAERLRKVVEKKVAISFSDTKLVEVLAFLAKAADLHIKPPAGAKDLVVTTGDVGEVSLGAAFQLLEDTVPGHRFIVREYGLLFVAEDKIPPGAATLMAFWKGGERKADAPKKAGEGIRGKVSKVDDKLMRIDIGADSGLKKGDTLEVFRTTGPKPAFLGQARVVEVTGKEAVAQMFGDLNGNPAPGDLVG
ncbi:MAG: hypothetical protein K2W96_07635, partial [Gemmataceae bacterium]|nr:hypothetical protein [Gemmataceae bacterium]